MIKNRVARPVVSKFRLWETYATNVLFETSQTIKDMSMKTSKINKLTFYCNSNVGAPSTDYTESQFCNTRPV